MKFTLIRNSTDPAEVLSSWEVRELHLEGADLFETLRRLLTGVMEGILDPDIAGKKPDGFLSNLQKGVLGDFSKRYIVTAYDRNEVIGLLIGLPEANQRLHIYSMGVLKPYRHRGVGSAMLAKCINDMRQRNVCEIILDVHSNNIPAYNLYKQMGFFKDL